MANKKKSKKYKVKVTENGPYLVTGGLSLSEEIIETDEDGISVGWKKGKKFGVKEEYALCRCGHSGNQPYCNRAHAEKNFDGSETASKKGFKEQAEFINGKGVALYDAEALCAVARFCDLGKGAWQLAEDSGDPEDKKLCIKESELCPSGRLVAVDKKTGKVYEPEFDPSIVLIQDPARKVSGPLYLKGGIPVISADGFEYEVRNRQTLCRCGESKNKPFCDGTHISCGFRDDIPENKG